MIKLLIALSALVAAPDAATPSYAEGQVWEYRTRAGEEDSLLKIQRIEQQPAAADGPIYHLSITGVNLGPHMVGALPHTPVSRVTLDASVTRLASRRAEFPSADEGIKEWRRAQGGVFTLPVAGILDAVQQMLEAEPRRGD